MSQEVYVVKEKFRTPALPLTPPHPSGMLTGTMFILAGFGVLTFLTGFVSSTLLLVLVGFGSFAAAVGAHFLRKHLYRKDQTKYLETLEYQWMSSEGFIPMRDFMMMLGFSAETAFEITNTIGSEVLSTRAYAEAQGYYPLPSVVGGEGFAAVHVAGFLSAKDNLKVTVKILHETR